MFPKAMWTGNEDVLQKTTPCARGTNKLHLGCYCRYGDILRVLLLSSFGKLLAFPAVVWGQTHSAVYLGLTRLFIFTSNVVAFKGIIAALVTIIGFM